MSSPGEPDTTGFRPPWSTEPAVGCRLQSVGGLKGRACLMLQDPVERGIQVPSPDLPLCVRQPATTTSLALVKRLEQLLLLLRKDEQELLAKQTPQAVDTTLKQNSTKMSSKLIEGISATSDVRAVSSPPLVLEHASAGLGQKTGATIIFTCRNTRG